MKQKMALFFSLVSLKGKHLKINKINGLFFQMAYFLVFLRQGSHHAMIWYCQGSVPMTIGTMG